MSTITHDRAVRDLVVGRTIFEYADELSVVVPTSCQRNGRCHECVVEIRQGMAGLSRPSEAESFLRGDFRLACQAEVVSADEDIEFAALRRRPRILTTRSAKQGLKSVIINCNARPEWAPYQDKRYDPFWARAEELDQPVTLHIITGNEVDPFTLHGSDRIRVPVTHLGVCAEAGPVLANEFIFGGILDRFPNLKLVCSEFEVSWLPYWLFRVRQIQDDFGPVLKIPAIKKPVDAYMRQIYHGLIDDPFLYNVLDLIDPKTIMWGSDFPHTRCTYPNTREVIDRIFATLDETTRNDIVYANCARLYNFDLPAV